MNQEKGNPKCFVCGKYQTPSGQRVLKGEYAHRECSD